MKTFLLPALIVLAGVTATAAPNAKPSTSESHTTRPAHNKVDKLAFGRMERLGIQPADICSDDVFVRRAYLDVIGTLPTAQIPGCPLPCLRMKLTIFI
jgi:hypothetical protein